MKIKTRVRIVLLGFCLLVGSLGAFAAFSASAAPEGIVTPVYLGQEEVLAGECLRINGTTYVPLRNFSSLLGAKDISWNNWTKTATVRSDSLSMTVRTGNLYIEANGHYFYTVGEIRNLSGSLYVPIRPLARAFALELEWDASVNAVRLSRRHTAGDRRLTAGAPVEPVPVAVPSLRRIMTPIPSTGSRASFPPKRAASVWKGRSPLETWFTTAWRRPNFQTPFGA